MGGKRKTKWRKLPLEELTEDGNSESTTAGNSGEKLQGERNEDDYGDAQFELRPGEWQWSETGHSGSWIPNLHVDNDVASYETTVSHSQIPVFLFPSVLPYCATPYSDFRTVYPLDYPFYPNPFIPFDPHNYHHFICPRPESKDGEHSTGDKAVNSSQTLDSTADDKQKPPQPPQLVPDDSENQQTTSALDMISEEVIPYSYPTYAFEEPMYSVPIYPLGYPTHRTVPRVPWSALQAQRKRRRKRREYNADYAVIPPKTPSNGKSGTKSDLEGAGHEISGNNGSPSQQKGNDVHSISQTRESPTTDPEKQNIRLLNSVESVTLAPISENQEVLSLEYSKSVSVDYSIATSTKCENVDSTTKQQLPNAPPSDEEGFNSLTDETDLRREIEKDGRKNQRTLSENCGIKDDVDLLCRTTKEVEHKSKTIGEKSINNSIKCDDKSADLEMEEIWHPNLDYSQVQDEGSCKNVHYPAKGEFSSEAAFDCFVRNKNKENLAHLKTAEPIDEFFDLSFNDDGGDAVEENRNTKNTSPAANAKLESSRTRDEREKDFSVRAINSESNNDDLVLHQQNHDCSQKADARGKDEEATEAKYALASLDSVLASEGCPEAQTQLSDSLRSSPHSFLSFVANSEALIRETELELSKIQHLTSRPPLLANQSIYKFAFDENVTDQSETEDALTPIPSPVPKSSEGYTKEPENVSTSAEMRQDFESSEIIVHEGDSGSEAGSEDVELLPHRCESDGDNKHLYVNKLSLAMELLRTHENLPYDEEFKRVVEEDSEGAKSQTIKKASVFSGAVNLAFVEEERTFFESCSPTKDDSAESIVCESSVTNVQAAELQGQHRHSCISTADSGVQSEDSGDEVGEVGKEPFGPLGFTETEDQELWNPTEDTTAGYRRFGVRHGFRIFAPRAAGSWNQCFCCTIM